MTVAENFEAARRPARDGGTRWDLDQVLELFPDVAQFLNRRASALSGGQQRMVAIARTLMGNPSLLLLDEPSEGLAPRIVEQMARAILSIKASGVAIVLSEQNMHFASLVSDRAYVIEKGQVRYTGTMAELKNNDEVRRNYIAL